MLGPRRLPCASGRYFPGGALPHTWISGDDELGRSGPFRRELRARQERYLLAVPSNTAVPDLTAPDPPYGRHGRRPSAPFQRADRWCAALPEGAWETVEVRAGERGPITVQAARALVQARTEGRVSEVAEALVLFREAQGDGTWKHDYLLSNAALGVPLSEYSRVFKAQHRVEECLQRAKGEAGLADYEVRTWRGWYHHQALALTAAWFLTQEARRGKKWTPALTIAQLQKLIAGVLERRFGTGASEYMRRTASRRLRRIEEARFCRWKALKRLAPRRVSQKE
jgi:SRSO17 transposase